jgi:hypothetical protein
MEENTIFADGLSGIAGAMARAGSGRAPCEGTVADGSAASTRSAPAPAAASTERADEMDFFSIPVLSIAKKFSELRFLARA